MLGEFEKNEFRRFFEYAFSCIPKYWGDLKDWELIGLNRLRTLDEEKRYLALLNKIIQSETHLKRIMGDVSLNPVVGLKYYAWLFLNEMGKDGGIQKPVVNLDDLKQPIEKLIETIKATNNSLDLKQEALTKARSLLHCSNLPEKVFDKSIFDKEKWDKWFAQSNTLPSVGTYKKIDKNAYLANMVKFTTLNWQQIEMYAEGYVRNTNEKPTVVAPQAPVYTFNELPLPQEPPWPHPYTPEPHSKNYVMSNSIETIEAHIWNLEHSWPPGGGDAVLAPGIRHLLAYKIAKMNHANEVARIQNLNAINKEKAFAEYNQKQKEYEWYQKLVSIIESKWQLYRKEQDVEFPALYKEYEAKLIIPFFPKPYDFLNDPQQDKELLILEKANAEYINLGAHFGNERVKKIWCSPKLIAEIFVQDFAWQLKSVLMKRLAEISLLTVRELEILRVNIEK